MDNSRFAYDVCLSFAGEQRNYVEEVAIELNHYDIRVFYDDDEKVNLWGKDLSSFLDDIYQNRCEYCIIFISKEYANKMWTNHERRSAQARALKERQEYKEYILPAKFDDTSIQGLPHTIHYIDLSQISQLDFVKIIIEKIGDRRRHEYLPPVLDVLIKRLDAENDTHLQEYIHSIAHCFFGVLCQMTEEERDAVLKLILFGCLAGLPENIHIHADLLHRHTEKSIAELKQLLGNIRSLGFKCSFRESVNEDICAHETILGDDYYFELNWTDLSVHDIEYEYPEMYIVSEMVHGTVSNFCEGCATKALDRLDFSQLDSRAAEKNVV